MPPFKKHRPKPGSPAEEPATPATPPGSGTAPGPDAAQPGAAHPNPEHESQVASVAASASRREFLKTAGLAAAGAAVGGLGGAAIGAAVGAGGGRLDFPKDAKTPKPGFEHLVVVMYENRSFDNILGRLYEHEEVPDGASFEGLQKGTHSNPVPGTDQVVEAQVYSGSTDEIMSSPHPDPGEEYSHVNTQLFDIVDPPGNENLHDNGLQGPFNAPPAGAKPTMKGFLRDYIINYEHLTENKKRASEKEWKLAMGGFSADMLPVFSTLAKNFAVYDHWHCAVPSQTFCNRSFFHASTSHGYVTNRGDGGYDKWLDGNAYAPTVFNRLEDAGISWRVYYDAAQLVSMTGVLHAPATEKYWKSNFRTLDQFYMDAESGNLPAYSFIEPRMVFNHNDMHPPYGVLREGNDGEGGIVTDGAVSDVRAGDALLHFLYAAIRQSKSEKGSNALNTMLLVTFDEHGGTYDHVPPPAADPPGDGKRGEMGFGFDRLGCRVPAIAISAYTAKNTIINDEMHHGSVIATLSRQHGLEPLTFRDQGAPDLSNAINLKTPRPASEWPVTVPHFVPHNPDDQLDPNAPEHRGKKLSNPARGLLGLLIAKFGRRDEVAPDTYEEAFKALALHGTGLFGTLDEAPLEQPE